ncbi:hypothetical protein GGTG_10815 [Gaeumannomyces tritici R3-111a-1]|uniref:Uncharacterized protein n=1 Tax=Gaeumannomyces tritici (strain R3-111a-1) TaxID=644352 RepID=J3PBE1_GAET3|nr:hypothetical protein GGTG_10815 [Gaeumannomyces tritici R3-111a-1]EJT71558.1 hypothetical protein GGTG_10815 [Gaeumannomyces tritici R3-111a-1]
MDSSCIQRLLQRVLGLLGTWPARRLTPVAIITCQTFPKRTRPGAGGLQLP